MEALVVGIALGCLLVSLTALIVMGLTPYAECINKLFRRK